MKRSKDKQIERSVNCFGLIGDDDIAVSSANDNLDELKLVGGILCWRVFSSYFFMLLAILPQSSKEIILIEMRQLLRFGLMWIWKTFLISFVPTVARRSERDNQRNI